MPKMDMEAREEAKKKAARAKKKSAEKADKGGTDKKE